MTVAGLDGGHGSVPCSGAWLGGCLGSVAARPAVPARPLPFLPVVLWNGCALLPCRRSRVGDRIWSGRLSVWEFGSARWWLSVDGFLPVVLSG